jgi:hypothetical protein
MPRSPAPGAKLSSRTRGQLREVLKAQTAQEQASVDAQRLIIRAMLAESPVGADVANGLQVLEFLTYLKKGRFAYLPSQKRIAQRRYDAVSSLWMRLNPGQVPDAIVSAQEFRDYWPQTKRLLADVLRTVEAANGLAPALKASLAADHYLLRQRTRQGNDGVQGVLTGPVRDHAASGWKDGGRRKLNPPASFRPVESKWYACFLWENKVKKSRRGALEKDKDSIKIEWNPGKATAFEHYESNFAQLPKDQRPFLDQIYRASPAYYNALAQALRPRGQKLSDVFTSRRSARGGGLARRGYEITPENAFLELERQRQLRNERVRKHRARKKAEHPDND